MASTDRTTLLATAETHHGKVSERAKGSAADAVAAGRALLAAKAAAPAKGWAAALKGNTSMKQQRVQRYMVLARATDAGMLGEGIAEMSFSEAYKLAIRQAVRIARKSAAPAPAGDPAATEERQKALKTFRQALRSAIGAGIPFKVLEQELANRAGAEFLGAAPPAAGGTAP